MTTPEITPENTPDVTPEITPEVTPAAVPTALSTEDMEDMFKGMTAGVELNDKVWCGICEHRRDLFDEFLTERRAEAEASNGELEAPPDDLALALPIREAECRFKACGTEWQLMCGLCMQATFMTMAAEVARGIAEGLPMCEPCMKPIPFLPMVIEHMECEKLDGSPGGFMGFGVARGD